MNYPFKYIVASVLLILYARKAEHLVQSASMDKSTSWLARILRAFWWYFTVIVVVVVIDFALFFDASFKTFYWFFTRFYYYPLFIGVAGLTYWLGLASFHQRTRPRIRQSKANPAKQAALQDLAGRLTAHMQQAKAYQDPELSLAVLAEQLQVKPYLVSQCLKEVLNTKFSDYVNQLRIAELKRQLQDPGKAHYTLLSLAYDAGFNSKASFQRAVKKYEGLSPSQLKEKVLK
ncbi:MAG: helix-turn-helix transcriptional regulator, partial [Bacteroidota bacterium]